MELRKDILKISKKSRFRIIMGMGFFLIAIFWVADRAFEYQDIRPFDWLYFSFFIFSGIIHTYEGFGYSFSKLFGKAFVLIDQDVIRIKTGVLEKEQFITWNEVVSVHYKAGIFEMRRLDQPSVVFKLSGLEYSLIQQIKELISLISKEKGISASI
ncbi:MAG: hypothetical protein WCL21_07280 [Mariniphaga sp.]